MTFKIPANYTPKLPTREVERAIKDIKDFFESHFSKALNLNRVSAPLFVRSGLGINDDLNGIEKPVSFKVSGIEKVEVEMVQSLAKWKRLALAEYGYSTGEGIYTDMNAIRPDETLDHVHSVYVDQWDWEKIIKPGDRNVETLTSTVASIYEAIRRTEYHLASIYPHIHPVLPQQITTITTQELYERWPKLSPKEREDEICREKGAVFLIGIGADLPDGKPHDGRAPDYDDWITPRKDGGLGLNGDILLWNPILNRAFEISSMGIRVNPETLIQQLEIRGATARKDLFFHKKLLEGKLPQTMGGGIGQSRLCMFFLRTIHIGEVAVGLWPDAMVIDCKKAGIALL